MYIQHVTNLLSSSKPIAIGKAFGRQAGRTISVQSNRQDSVRRFPIVEKSWSSYLQLQPVLDEVMTRQEMKTRCVVTAVGNRFTIVIGDDGSQNDMLKKRLLEKALGSFVVAVEDYDATDRAKHFGHASDDTGRVKELKDADISNLTTFIGGHFWLHHPELLAVKSPVWASRLVSQVKQRVSVASTLERVRQNWVGSGIDRSHFDLIAQIMKAPSAPISHQHNGEWKKLLHDVSRQILIELNLPREISDLAKDTLDKPMDWRVASYFHQQADDYQTEIMLKALRAWNRSIADNKAVAVVINDERLPRFLAAIQRDTDNKVN